MQSSEAWLYGGAMSCIATILIDYYEVSASKLGVLLACARTYNLDLRIPQMIANVVASDVALMAGAETSI